MLLMDKMDVNIDCPSWFGLRSKILGENGANLDFIKTETDVAVILKGAERSKIMPLHFSFICDDKYPEKLTKAKKLALDLIYSIREDLAACTAAAATAPAPDLKWETNKIPNEDRPVTQTGEPFSIHKSIKTMKGPMKKQQPIISTKVTPETPIWKEPLEKKNNIGFVKNIPQFQKHIPAKNKPTVFASRTPSQKKNQNNFQHQPSATMSSRSQEIPILKPPPVLSAMISKSQNQNFTEHLQSPPLFSANITPQIHNQDDLPKAQISNTQSQFVPVPPFPIPPAPVPSAPVMSMLATPQRGSQNETTQLVKLDPNQQILVAPDGTQYLQVKVQSNETNTHNYFQTPNLVPPIMVDPTQIMNSMMGINPMMEFSAAQQAILPGNILQVNSQTTMVQNQDDKTIASQVSTNLLTGMGVNKQAFASAVPPILPPHQKVTKLESVRPVFAARESGSSVPWFGAGAVPAAAPVPVPVPVAVAVPTPTTVPAPAPLPVPAVDTFPPGVLGAAKSWIGGTSVDALKQMKSGGADGRAARTSSSDTSEQWEHKLAEMRTRQRQLLEEAKKTGDFAAFEKSVRNYNEIVKYIKEGEKQRAAGAGKDDTDYSHVEMDESSDDERAPRADDTKRSPSRDNAKRKRSRTRSRSSSSDRNSRSRVSSSRDVKAKKKDSKRDTKSPDKWHTRYGRKKIEILFERDLPRRGSKCAKSKSKIYRRSPKKSPKRERDPKEKRSLTPEVLVVKEVDSTKKIDTKVPFYASQSSKPVTSEGARPGSRASDPWVKKTDKSSEDSFSTKNVSKKQSEFPYTSWADTKVPKYPIKEKLVNDAVPNKTNIPNKEAILAKKIQGTNLKSIGTYDKSYKTNVISSGNKVECYSPTRATESYNVETKDWNNLTAKLRRNIDAIKTQNVDRNNTFDIVSRDSGRDPAEISQTCVTDKIKNNFNIKPTPNFSKTSIELSDQYGQKKTPWVDSGRDHFSIKSAEGFADRSRDNNNLYGMKKEPWKDADKDFFSIKPSQTPYESPKVSTHSQNDWPKKESDNFNIMSNSYRVPDSNYKENPVQSNLNSNSQWITRSQNKGYISEKRPEPKWEIPSRHESETYEKNPRSESGPNWEVKPRPEVKPNWETPSCFKEKLDRNSQATLENKSDWEISPRAVKDSDLVIQPRLEKRSDIESQPGAEGRPNWETHSRSEERYGWTNHPLSAVTPDWDSQPKSEVRNAWETLPESKGKPNWETHPGSKGKPNWETQYGLQGKPNWETQHGSKGKPSWERQPGKLPLTETHPMAQGSTDLGTPPISKGLCDWQKQPNFGGKPNSDAHPRPVGRPDWETKPMSAQRPDWEAQPLLTRRPDWEKHPVSSGRPDWETQPMSTRRPNWETHSTNVGNSDWEPAPLRGYTDSVWLSKKDKASFSREMPDNSDSRRRNFDDTWKAGGRGGWC